MSEVELFIITGLTITLTLSLFIISFLFISHRRRQQYISEKMSMQNQFQQELIRTQFETQEETFHQISEEIHDNIGQLLSTSKLLLNYAKKSIIDVPDALNTAEETLGKAILDLRALSKCLNKEWLHQFNVIDNLKTEVERINAAKVIATKLECKVIFLPLLAEAQVVLFRIIQEAIQNSIKHANSTEINMRIDFHDKTVSVSIEDNGNGFNIKKLPANGMGLLNMRHRTELLGGTIQWTPLPDKGTHVSIQIPIQEQHI